MTDITLTQEQLQALLSIFGCPPPTHETPQKEWRFNVSLSVALRIGMYGSEAPTASFSYVVNGQDVTFTYTGTSAETVVWNFGDGGNGTVQFNPTHTYVGSGPFTVTLTAYNPMGQATTSQIINLAPPATWASVLASYNPIYNFPLTEASGNFANTGSRSGSVPTGSAQGTPVYQAGSFIAPATGIGVQSGDGFNYNSDPPTGSATVVLLIKPPASLANVDFVNSGGSALFLRCLSNGTLRMYDDLGPVTVSSAAGVLKPDEYNLIFYQPLIAGASKIYHTSQTDGGTVTEVASGSPFTAQMEGATTMRGSSNADTAIIEAYAVIQGALDLTQMQALADTLTW